MAVFLRLVEQVLKGRAVVDRFERLLRPLPERAEDAASVDGADVVLVAAFDGAEVALHEADDLADRYRGGRTREEISAVLASRGIDEARALQAVQYVFEKAHRNALRLGDGPYLARPRLARSYIARSAYWHFCVIAINITFSINLVKITTRQGLCQQAVENLPRAGGGMSFARARRIYGDGVNRAPAP